MDARFAPSLVGILCAAVLAPRAFAQSTQRVSVDSAGAQSDGLSALLSVSGDGRYVVFESQATNLVLGDTNGRTDVFLRDVLAGTTTRINLSTAGAEADGDPYFVGGPRISADGRFVAFASYATNLVAGDTNGEVDVFVRDLAAGTTTRISVDSFGAQGDLGSFEPTISADGSLVAFSSRATNLVPGDTNGFIDVFVHDRNTGDTHRVSVTTGGVDGNDHSRPAILSADGRWVAFTSFATNLVAGDTNNAWDTFVHEIATGITTRVSVDAAGIQGNGRSYGFPSISADGRFVAFQTAASNFVPGDTNNADDVYVHDRLTGRVERASLSSTGGQGINGVSSYNPAISGDGRIVVFQTISDLVPGDTNNAIDYFARDLATRQTTRVNLTSSGAQSAGEHGIIFTGASVSASERFVAFFNGASDLVPGDTNGTYDAFLRDRFGFDPPVIFCTGDGSGAACPCGNSGIAWRGCNNSAATGGAVLSASGAPSISSDTLILASSGELPSAFSLFLQGDLEIAPRNFGDGLRCVGGTLKRLFSHSAASGAVTAPQGADPSITARSAALGDTIAANSTRVYLVYYRDPNAAFCPPPAGSTFNSTNGLRVLWAP